MTITEFNKEFGTKINNADQWIYEYGKLKITDLITIDEIEYAFNHKRLVYLKCKYNKDLYDGLSKKYGIKASRKTSDGKTFFMINTKSKTIICVGLTNQELVIYDSSVKIDSPFLKVTLHSDAIEEYKRKDIYKGL